MADIRQLAAIVGKVHGCYARQQLVDQSRDLENDLLENWQPVQLLQHRCDVVTPPSTNDQARSCVVDRLHAVQEPVVDAIQQ